MAYNRASIPVHTSIDIFALFNRKELFALSNVCHRYNAIVNQKFANAPYLLFEELAHSMMAHKWMMNQGSGYTNMPTHLIALLKESKFVRFNLTRCYSKDHPLIDELTPMKHVFEGQTLVISNVTLGDITVTADLVQKCRSLRILEMKLTDFSIILPRILANNHDQVGLHVSSMGTNPLIMPVTNVVDFLFSQTSNGSRKMLTVVSKTPLNSENSATIAKAIKEKFLASSVPFRFKFTLFGYGDNYAEKEISKCENGIGQSLEIVLDGNDVQCQVK